VEPGAGYFDRRTHVLPVRVHYQDTDAAGRVYYAEYRRYGERGRSDMPRRAGVTRGSLDATDDDPLARTLFVVRKREVEYLRPARARDALRSVTRDNEENLRNAC
jgi:acyl-CoA thioester hydrolase